VEDIQQFSEPLSGLPKEQIDQLHGYLDALLRANKRINLTALRDWDEAMQRHIVESVRLSNELPDARCLIDVGSGGGLPGMVLAIVKPGLKVTLLEATEKKARFLEETVHSLALPNVEIDCRRAEEAASLGSELREAFDVATARAVASLPTLLELTLPFVRTDGRLFAVKGERAAKELEASGPALSQLNSELERCVRHPSATIVVVKKLSPCPSKFPRKTGEPKRNPL
jgi:16S rRNA (guanine527-N7)-methyltransferase